MARRSRSASPARSSIERSRATSDDALGKALDEADELVLVTRGRKSGRDHRVTLWFAREGDVLWLRTDERTDWYLNLVAHPLARVIVDGRELAVRYEPSEGVNEDLRRLVPLWRAKYGPMWVQDWFIESGRVPVRLRLTR